MGRRAGPEYPKRSFPATGTPRSAQESAPDDLTRRRVARRRARRARRAVAALRGPPTSARRTPAELLALNGGPVMPSHIRVRTTHVHASAGAARRRTDDELKAFLQSNVHDDHQIAARNDLEEPIPWRDFEAMDRVNPITSAIAEAGIVGENDVYCITRIVNGEVRADGTRDESDDATVPNYLQLYLTEDGFNFPKLINDDYFVAIHLLWNNRKFVSCLKLVFSAIDTLSFVEYGPDRRDCFTSWLDEYCDLGAIGVTSGELWELRNSLIHMTNLDSRKVRSGSTDRLLPRFTHPDRDVAPFVDGMKVLHVARFVRAVLPRGIEKWLQSYNQDPGKFAEFVERYDTIVSEARLVEH
ncbi:MAG: hypothetical protein OXC29_15455 [Rhodococcus sp.]|nr:hypothetical protein [Rhodococcus sp. (in: high G+C Gram-positive bacteria)]